MPQNPKQSDKFFDQFDDDKSFFDSYENEVPPKVMGDTYKGPTTFGGGFKESLKSGDALSAGMSGLGGYAKGALLDLPSSIMGGIKGIGNAITNPVESMEGAYNTIKKAPSNIMNTTMRAGSEPENFGRMMGQMTGQPLATAGLMKAAPYAPQTAISGAKMMGKPVEAIGGLTSREGMVSGFLPPVTTPRYLKMAERLAGRGIQKIGQKMQGLETPDYLKADYIKSLPSRIFKSDDLPPPNVSVADEGNVTSSTFTNQKLLGTGREGKLKIRLDANGKFIDMNTGEEVSPLAYQNEYEPWKGARIIGDKLKSVFNPEPLVKPNFQGNPSKTRAPYVPRFSKSGVSDKIDNSPSTSLVKQTPLANQSGDAPTLAGFQNHNNGIVQLQFNRAGKPVSVEDIKAMFPSRNISITKFKENLLSPHLQKFRIDVFDRNGRMSSKVAKEMEDEIGGSFHDWQQAGRARFNKE